MKLKQAVKFFHYGNDKDWYQGAIKVIDAILNKNVIRNAHCSPYGIESYTYYVVMTDSDVYHDILNVAKDKKFKDNEDALRYFEKVNNIVSITIYRLEPIDEKKYV